MNNELRNVYRALDVASVASSSLFAIALLVPISKAAKIACVGIGGVLAITSTIAEKDLSRIGK